MRILMALGCAICVVCLLPCALHNQDKKPAPEDTVDKITGEKFELPEPETKGEVSIEEAISKRRSVRDFQDKHITIKALSQLLWAAQGITDKVRKFRAAPSAGALYPMEVFAVLPSGVYRYKPETHSIERITEGDKRRELSLASLDQEYVRTASINIVITAVYERSSIKYGKRAERYCAIEACAISENIYLQVVSLKLGTVLIGAFEDEEVQEVLGLKKSERPLIIMPVGFPK